MRKSTSGRWSVGRIHTISKYVRCVMLYLLLLMMKLFSNDSQVLISQDTTYIYSQPYTPQVNVPGGGWAEAHDE